MLSLQFVVARRKAKRIMFLIFILTLLVVPVVTYTQSNRGAWDGAWNTYWNGHYIAMVIMQDAGASQVDGCFSLENFQAALMCPYTMSCQATGGTLKGTYRSDKGSGSFEFNLSPDGKSFLGNGEGEMPNSAGQLEHWSGPWRGEMTESAGTKPKPIREIPWDIVIGAGVTGAIGLAAVVIARTRSRNPEEDKGSDTVSLILQLSDNKITVGYGKPATLLVRAWRVDKKGDHKPAPEADLELISYKTSEFITFSPTRGKGEIEATISTFAKLPTRPLASGSITLVIHVNATLGESSTSELVGVTVVSPRLIICDKELGKIEPRKNVDKPNLVEVAAQMPVTKFEEGYEGYNPSKPTILYAYILFGEVGFDKDLDDEKWVFSSMFDPSDLDEPEVNIKNVLGRKAKIMISAQYRSDIPPDTERSLKVLAERGDIALEERVDVAVYHRLCPEAVKAFNIEEYDEASKATHLRTSFQYVRRSWMNAIERYNKIYVAPAYTTTSDEGNPIDAGLWLFGFRDQKSKPAAKYTFTPRDEKYEVPGNIVTINSWINTELMGKKVKSTKDWVAPRRTEAALAQDVINEYNKSKKLLSPGDVLYLALKQTSGDVRMAMLMAHNTLRALARNEGDFNWCGIRQLPVPFNKIFEPIRGNRVSYQDPKTDGLAGDYGGPWYHLFGTAFYELETAAGTRGVQVTSSWTDFAQEFEEFYRKWFGGQPNDPEKYCINLWGAFIARELFNKLKHDWAP